MAAVVCHGLQSHLESQILESRTLRLRLPNSSKLLPSNSQKPIDLAIKSCLRDSNIKTHVEEEGKIETQTPLSSKPNDMSGLNFLEALSNVPTKELSSQYVHPQHNRSSLVLSPKSLELCTENLGSESGSDIVHNHIDINMNMNMNMNMLSSLDYYVGGNIGTMEEREPCKNLAAKKGKAMNFPPPLTTITGSESLRLRPHREDGRLVIEVTKALPMFASCFHAERSHGCLRLRFSNNHIQCFDPEEEEEDVDELDPIILTNEEMGDIEEGEEMEEEEEDDVDVDVGCECKMRMEKYELPRRCKDGDEHENNELLLTWGESHWVVTS
ncbi:putative The fantastic four family protein [Lupinus albus]|uniref:Putative The fantastic four family protein n=1 Tax=Lupinus albus TaxID=3870 RepID=A0A6A4NBH3_LUPAL|nr:putative The fantastic four family protein [Lupinus albus]